jgi:hypothetical protein
MTAATVKRCACGAVFTRVEFDALDRAGRSEAPHTMDGVEWLDYRLCSGCRSTITLEVPKPGATLWWLSFCDPARPSGSSFVGCAIVHGDGLVDAVRTAWRTGCNPGGDVMGVPFPSEVAERVEARWRGRILSSEEALRLDSLLAGATSAQMLTSELTSKRNEEVRP